MKQSEVQADDLHDQAARLGAQLAARGLKVATAESCTGGWIAKTFTDVAGSSAWFNGGIVSYSNDAKHDLLGVQKETLAVHGAVSEAVVLDMACGALNALDVDCAVSVSGVAGPGGGSPAKPVGLVWIAVARRSEAAIPAVAEKKGASAVPFSMARECHFKGDRDAVRRAAVAAAIQLVSQVLESD